jgi:pimeloyl-ACP methyl ester carboxylesterase
VTLWRSFPADLCERLGWRGLVFSRYGYGFSSIRPSHGAQDPDYLEREALVRLPVFLDALGVENCWLLGHSDGGTIALVAAANDAANRFDGIVVIAPHYLIEPEAVAGIRVAKDQFENGDLRPRMAKYHRDVDSVFYGWSEIWLDPEQFRTWTIEPMLSEIRCPVLAVQGTDDEYATLDQIEAIARHAPQTELLVVEGAGHTPCLSNKSEVIDAVSDFINRTVSKD